MPYLLIENRNDGEWTAADLHGEEYVLAIDGMIQPGREDRAESAGHAALVARVGCGRGAAWALLTGPRCAARINGEPMPAGIRLLKHRDEILAAEPGSARRARWFFSEHRHARIEPFPGPEAVTCPRCKTDILPGQPAVECPSCGLWSHMEIQARNCWTYAEHCAGGCGASTFMDDEPLWTPESL